MRNKKFADIAFDSDDKTFVIHVAFLTNSDLDPEVYLSWKAQMSFLKTDKTFISIFFNLAIVFSINSIAKFLKHTEIKNYTKYLIKSWQLSYEPIYN